MIFIPNVPKSFLSFTRICRSFVFLVNIISEKNIVEAGSQENKMTASRVKSDPVVSEVRQNYAKLDTQTKTQKPEGWVNYFLIYKLQYISSLCLFFFTYQISSTYSTPTKEKRVQDENSNELENKGTMDLFMKILINRKFLSVSSHFSISRYFNLISSY